MKSTKNLLEQLKSLPYFSKTAVYQLGEHAGLKRTSVDTCVGRFLKRKEIISLKNGLYVSADFFDKNRGDSSYPFYLANIIRTPSYVSSWAALQHHNLTTEAINSITSVTAKVTRSYQTKAGNFDYKSIKRDLFSGFSLMKGTPTASTGKFDFFIASPSKALFDLLYFRTSQFRGIKFENIESLVKELRIDIEEMSKEERDNFYSLIKKHLS